MVFNGNGRSSVIIHGGGGFGGSHDFKGRQGDQSIFIEGGV